MGKNNVYLFITIHDDYVCCYGNCHTYIIMIYEKLMVNNIYSWIGQ